MDATQAAILAGHPHDLIELGVIDHHHAGHHHEHFETAHPLALQDRLHIDQGLVVKRGDDHMGADIDTGVLGAGPPILQAGNHTVAVRLLGIIDQGRGPAEGRRFGARLKSIDGLRSAHFCFQVGVHVDPAGQNQKPLGIDDGGITSGVDVETDHLDPAIVDQNVRTVIVRRSDDPAVSDEGGGHRRLSQRWRNTIR